MTGKLGILTSAGFRIVEAMTGGSVPPGLALCLVPLDDGVPEGASWRHTDERWSVTHVESGRRIGPGWVALPDARRAAEALAGVCDWTVPGEQLAGNPEIAQHALEAITGMLAAQDDA